MLRRLAVVSLAALAVAACKKSSPTVAEGKGFKITADDFKARIQEQSPFIRGRFNTPERKKEFLDNLVRIEVLGREAERKGFEKDPEVQQMLRRMAIQKLVQQKFGDPSTASVPDADVQKYYDEHPTEFHRPKRVRATIVLFAAAPGSPDRSKKLAAAKKALASLETSVQERKDVASLAKLVAEASEDPVTKAKGGDTELKTAEEMEQAFSKELATALFAMKQNELSGVIDTPAGYVIARVSMVQEGFDRTLEQAKPQIVQRLSREVKAKEFDAWVKQLEADAKVTIDEKALAAVDIGPTAGAPGVSAPGQPEAAPLTSQPPPAPKPGGDAKPAQQ